MSREVKRVALDFDWPLKKVWDGYLNPHHSETCASCDGSGYNVATKALADGWYSFDRARWIDLGNGRRYNDLAWSHHLEAPEIEALVKAGRLHDFTSRWDSTLRKWVDKDPPYMPTPAEVNAWSLRGFGHDAINKYICVKARAERLGVYGHCAVCQGEGAIWPSPEVKAASEAWECTEPPAGEGYQMWETTTEGSPMSPVFSTAEGLAQWLTGTGASAFGGQTATYQGWLRVCQGGFAPSLVGDEDGLRPGVDL